MELKQIFAFFKQNARIIIIVSILFGALGAAAYYFLPVKYKASGSLFVKRTIYPYSENHFTYEGYYGQQAAIFYTNSVIGLVQSEDIRAEALSKLEIEVNEENLRKYKRKIKTVKSGPQLVSVVVTEDTPEKAEALWNEVGIATVRALLNINADGDPFVDVAKVSEKPVIKESFRSLEVFTLIGFGLGSLTATTLLSLKSYLSPKKRK